MPDDPRAATLGEIDLYLTMACNLRCDFCAVRANEVDAEPMQRSRVLALIREAAGLGLEELHFSGGEPTLSPDLEIYVEAASASGVRTRVITNGFRLPLARVERLRDRGLGEMMVSVDGLAAAHNRLRGHPEAYDRALGAIRASLALGLRTRVSMVAYRENRDQIVPLMLEMDRIGVPAFSVFLGSPIGRAARHRLGSIFSAQEWREVCREIRRAVRESVRGMEVIYEQAYHPAGEDPIGPGLLRGRGVGCATVADSYDYLILRPDGNLYPCCAFVSDGPPLASVAGQSLADALEQARRRQVYRPFTEPHDRCVECPHLSRCGGGCPGYAYFTTGDWFRTDPRCEAGAGRAPLWYPVCLIRKVNARTGRIAGSSEEAFGVG